MNTGAMRRAQLVTPFGVGAMSVLVDGTSVITAGLDHWYEPEGRDDPAMEEYQEHDWRLEARLRVNELRLPPDYRYQGHGDDQRNVKLTVPALRFPRWHFCMYCKRLERSTLTMREAVRCENKEHGNSKPRMSQVPFVTICAAGHLDDFPFDAWVHRTANPSCKGPLRLRSIGGDGLEGQQVVCDRCGKKRSLGRITEAHDKNKEQHTFFSDNLSSPDDPYLCSGARPWLAEDEGACGLPMRGALRGAGNIYFPKVESSIYLPWKEGSVSAEMHDLMRHPAVSATMRTLHNIFGVDLEAGILRSQLRENVPPELFGPIPDEELIAGYRDLVGSGDEGNESDEESDAEFLTGNDEWRYPEFQLIRETPIDDYLTATDPGLHTDLSSHLERVRSVDVLRETRALRGFTRVYDDVLKLSAGKALLRREPLPSSQDWLPAYVVKGEGIYLELDPARLAAWEGRPEVQARAQRITDQYGKFTARRGGQGRALTPPVSCCCTHWGTCLSMSLFSPAGTVPRRSVNASTFRLMPSARWRDSSSTPRLATPRAPWVASCAWHGPTIYERCSSPPSPVPAGAPPTPSAWKRASRGKDRTPATWPPATAARYCRRPAARSSTASWIADWSSEPSRILRWDTSQRSPSSCSASLIAVARERARGGGTALETCSTCADRFPSRTNSSGKPWRSIAS